jgi:plastocyanin
MIQMRSLLRPRPAAVALATVAVPLPLHLVGHSHVPSGRHPAHAKRVSAVHHHHAPPSAGATGNDAAPSAGAPGNHAARSVGGTGKSRPGATRGSPVSPVPPSRKGGSVGPEARRSHLPKVSSHAWRLAFPAKPAARRAHAANDPGDTISDFKFTPGTLTIHAGDTVTWTNNGPTQHTATADDHSFDTGILNKGQSASHTFSQAGTFAYICTIHPFMHGTIIVLAASVTPSHPSSGSSGNGGSNGSSTTTPGSATTTTTPSANTTASGTTLPATGLDLSASVLLGLALLGVGLGLKRRVS